MTEWILRMPSEAERVSFAFALMFKVLAVLDLSLLAGAVMGPLVPPLFPMSLTLFGVTMVDILSCLGRCLHRVVPEAPQDQTRTSESETTITMHMTGEPATAEKWTG